MLKDAWYHNDKHIQQAISNCEFGDHNILIYPDLRKFSEIYTYHCREALKNNEIALILPTYESIDKVKNNLSDGGVDVDKHMEEGSLFIIDSVHGYHMPDVYGVLKLVKSLQQRAEREGKSGIIDFADVGSFFLLERTRLLVEYELSVPKKMDLKFKAFCCYHKKDFARLSRMQKKQLLDSHYQVIN
jgi:hypothetical protein